MREIWKTISSSGRSELPLAAGFPVPLVVRPLTTARRMRLRFDTGRGILTLTHPARMSRRAALAWVDEQRAWIEAQVAGALPPEPFRPDAVIPVEGRDIRINWDAAGPRSPRIDDGELRCGGTLEGLARRIETHLRRCALDTLSRETGELAGMAQVRARSVTVGDADSRWGSCSSQGRIRYSWRLILAPPQARRYVVAHEVAHLVHLNHGPAFKALEADLFGPGLDEAKALLRRVGPRLKRIGRGS